ncbi:hypothetical protein BH10PLA1_BH10PLA1_17620 [soil metagenome]
MIRREENGKFILIAQDDHAKLSGEMSKHIGNGAFESLLARSPEWGQRAINAIALHDSGWPEHDNAPTINTRQQPRDVFESKHDMSMELWTASADHAQAVDPYEGLMVSLHGLALSVIALSDVMHQFSRKNLAYTRERFDLNRFQHNEVERQSALRTQLGLRMDLPLHYGLTDLGLDPREDLLIHHFRTLQAMDRLSLALCCTRSPFESIDLPHHPGNPLTRVRIKRISERVLVMDPWIFDQPSLTVTVPAHVLPVQTYVGEAAFHAAYAFAEKVTLEFVLQPGKP